MLFNPRVQRILDDIKSQPTSDYNLNPLNKLPSYNDPTPLNDYVTPEKIKNGDNEQKYFNSYSQEPRIISTQTYEKPFIYQKQQNPSEYKVAPENISHITHNRNLSNTSNSYIRYVPPNDFQARQNFQIHNNGNQFSYIPGTSPSFYAGNNLSSYPPNSFYNMGNYNYYPNPTEVATVLPNTTINSNAEPLQKMQNNNEATKLPEKQMIILERGDRETRKGFCC